MKYTGRWTVRALPGGVQNIHFHGCRPRELPTLCTWRELWTWGPHDTLVRGGHGGLQGLGPSCHVSFCLLYRSRVWGP
jgi:hypothetical protein